jgi:hypothetical protein
MAKFWAEAQVLTDSKTTALSTDKTGFMGFLKRSGMDKFWGGRYGQHLNGQRVQTRVGKSSERIIHKAVLGHPAQTCETVRSNSHAKVGTSNGTQRTRVARMVCTFVNDPEFGG